MFLYALESLVILLWELGKELKRLPPGQGWRAKAGLVVMGFLVWLLFLLLYSL
jgi:hypothetical protein